MLQSSSWNEYWSQRTAAEYLKARVDDVLPDGWGLYLYVDHKKMQQKVFLQKPLTKMTNSTTIVASKIENSTLKFNFKITILDNYITSATGETATIYLTA